MKKSKVFQRRKVFCHNRMPASDALIWILTMSVLWSCFENYNDTVVGKFHSDLYTKNVCDAVLLELGLNSCSID